MENQLFCMCGTPCGHRHFDPCPFPYYGADKGEMDRWHDAARAAEAEYAAKLERRYEQAAPLTIAELRAA